MSQTSKVRGTIMPLQKFAQRQNDRQEEAKADLQALLEEVNLRKEKFYANQTDQLKQVYWEAYLVYDKVRQEVKVLDGRWKRSS